MVVIEMREAAYDKAFSLLEEIKDLGKKKKMAICELEDAIYECYEASKDKESDEREEDPEAPEWDEESSDIDFRRRSGYRSGMRMRKGMRDYEYEPEDDMHMRGYRRSGMRMRRNRYGRYSY